MLHFGAQITKISNHRKYPLYGNSTLELALAPIAKNMYKDPIGNKHLCFHR